MKYLIIYLSLTFLSNSLYAQNYAGKFVTINDGNEKQIKNNQLTFKPQFFNRKSSVIFGFKAGGTLSCMNFNIGYPRPEQPINMLWKPGFVAGFLIEVPVTDNLFIQPEYLYSYINGEHATIGETYTFSYVSLPVLLKYKLNKRWALIAGPQFDLLIKADKTANAIKSNITHDTEERSIAATAGLEFKLMEFLSLNARYIHGFNHIGIGQRSEVKEFKFEMAQLTAAIEF